MQTMTTYPRYAFYFVPEPDSALDRFGMSLLGYDARRGVDVAFPQSEALPADWQEISREPRRYGFHATLKAPMALLAGSSEDALLAAAAAFASTPRALPEIKPRIDLIGNFIAIIPASPSPELDWLAADCVRSFEPFRAPLTDKDWARRNPDGLSERQRHYLERWGYPYVLDEFRFHLTLTGPVEPGRQPALLQTLQDSFAQIGLETLAVDRVALFRQDAADRRFRNIAEWKLGTLGAAGSNS
jgi:putative phosphonate metabolism protein